MARNSFLFSLLLVVGFTGCGSTTPDKKVEKEPSETVKPDAGTAKEGATITFQEGLPAITLTQGELFINKDIVITGPGMDKLKISGADSTRVFETNKNVVVTISNLTITHGRVVAPDCQTDE